MENIGIHQRMYYKGCDGIIMPNVYYKRRRLGIQWGIQMDKLIGDFVLSLVQAEKDLIVDYAELGIDTILDNDVLKSIPFVRTALGGAKIGQLIYERNLCLQTVIFIKELNSGIIDKKKLEKHKRILASNPQKANNELGRVMILLNRNIEAAKSKLYARVYANYINQNINWDELCELFEIIEKIFISDLNMIYLRFNNSDGLLKYNKEEGYHLSRLESLGLIHDDIRFGALYPRDDDYNPIHHFQLSYIGKKLCESTILGGN